ncbi:MAG: hypothetical protein IT480_07685 [Gammaproteobacteria bacterium]|nr:hypothetical protein [Gammaproteobacteria bacterium]
MMHPRSTHALACWLLPWLVARLFVPAGIMPAAPAGEPGWILCSAAADGTPRPEAPGGSGGTHRETAPCPFAVAGAGAPPPPPILLLAPGTAGAVPPNPADAGPAWPVRPASAHRARAPPQYS